ncbi:MAG: peptidoglycan-binding domain-containing protein [Hyphomicrobiaceae bacterium]|nr:peptidoglycan-binding domain-containing protein [Hyphomicrobiaceae bacterium]
MRVWILAVSVLGILASADHATAGPSMTTRAASVAADPDPAASTEEATQATEDRIGLDKQKRRDVQRRLTRLGFDVKASGRFDEKTRAVILRWQAARDYPATGFLNTPQHQALLTESASTAQASISERPAAVSERTTRRRSARHHRGGGGGPIAAIGGVVGGVVGGVFGRR